MFIYRDPNVVVGPGLLRDNITIVFIKNDVVSMFPGAPPAKTKELKTVCSHLAYVEIIKKRIHVRYIIVVIVDFEFFNLKYYF